MDDIPTCQKTYDRHLHTINKQMGVLVVDAENGLVYIIQQVDGNETIFSFLFVSLL
ncbi:MAG: hypothetical protein DDT30_01672 [Dehalococcoidia bacterium]|nr:hypothetical protein [Bacillota bacterium]MBT9143320.1 hypothetical protein [Bacillota bacterium]